MAPRNDAADGRQRAARAVAVRRGELGMTQQELASKAGVDVKTVGSLETRGRWPIARSRVSIERALGWSSGELTRIAERGLDPAIPPEVRQKIMAAPRDDEWKRDAIAALEQLERGRRGEDPSGRRAG